MRMPTPREMVRLQQAAMEAAEKMMHQPPRLKQRYDPADLIEMLEKYPQIAGYACELLSGLDHVERVTHSESERDGTSMQLAVMALATLAKEILELDDERA